MSARSMRRRGSSKVGKKLPVRTPRSSTDFQLDDGGIWAVGECAVCGRAFCAITKNGKVRP